MLRPPFRNALLLIMLFLIGLTQTANAQNFYFTQDATINYAVNGGVVVGYGNIGDTFSGRNPTNPTINIVDGGSIAAGLAAYNSSKVIITGGSLHGLSAENHSTIIFAGGSINGLNLYDDSTAIVTGGSFRNNLFAQGNTTITISGGNIASDLFMMNMSTLNLVGTDLRATLISANNSGFSQYVLSGRLSDGTSINGKVLLVQNSSKPTVHFINTTVPEPGSSVLLLTITITGIGFFTRRRYISHNTNLCIMHNHAEARR